MINALVGAFIISILAPHEGCDFCARDNESARRTFQSSHPMRGATTAHVHIDARNLFQSSHPMRGATTVRLFPVPMSIFQSSHPMRGATRGQIDPAFHQQISILAPHEGCDRRELVVDLKRIQFQSSHPMRGATERFYRAGRYDRFQSSHPMRGAT